MQPALLFTCLLVFVSFAQSQTRQIGEIHVEPPESKVGVTIALKPSGPVPSSPEAMKILGDLAATNGLDLQPTTAWHFELTYDEFDEDGDNVHSGTVEELYVNSRKYRRTIKTDEFAQTEVADGANLYRAGDQGWPAQSTLQAMREVSSPLYAAIKVQDASVDKLEWTIGKTTLPCVALRIGRILSSNGWQKLCYEPGTTTLRYTRGQGWDETVYNHVFQFGQRYLAHDTEVTHDGKPYLKIQLTKIESVPQINESAFSPPAGSPGPLTGVVSVPSSILMKEYLVHGETPIQSFPKGISGKVNVTFRVNEEGRVIKVLAIEGPKQLKKPIEETVKRLQFRPFLVLDKPVEVESTTVYNVQSHEKFLFVIPGDPTAR